MSLSEDFAAPAALSKTKKRPAPFSLRLSKAERARLLEEAGGAPLGAYIKSKVLGDTAPLRGRRTGVSIEDRKAIAQLLALLGQTRFSSNLNQLAHLANIGLLALTPEERQELALCLAHIAQMRGVLISALGLKPGAEE